MARLIYSMLMSLDGYVADVNGKFDWAEPDEEVHRFVNDLQRPIGTYLYGRLLYDVMLYWENADAEPDQPEYIVDFARLWQAAQKVVYSTSLAAASSERTRIERTFEPDAVRAMKRSAQRDILIGGPDLAGQAIRAGLVEEYHFFLTPAVVGGGKRALADDIRLDLELIDERRFGNGMVYVRYRPA